MAVLIAALGFSALLWTLSLSRRSIVFAFAINWALMGWAFIVWLVMPLRFGSGYYQVHRFERSGRLYERLGVRGFQRFLRRTGLLGWNPSLRFVSRSGAHAALVAATCGPETAHALIFIVLGAVAVDAVCRGWWDTAGWLLLFNILHNAYPVVAPVRACANSAPLWPTERASARALEDSCIVGGSGAAQRRDAADGARLDGAPPLIPVFGRHREPSTREGMRQT
jgi:hypothetical protein